MTRRVHVRVVGKINRPRPQEATVTIDRAAGLMTVRVLRSRIVYTLPLATVAEMVAWRVIRANIAEKQRAKKAAKKARGK